jgi:hypothetical protein
VLCEYVEAALAAVLGPAAGYPAPVRPGAAYPPATPLPPAGTVDPDLVLQNAAGDGIEP